MNAVQWSEEILKAGLQASTSLTLQELLVAAVVLPQLVATSLGLEEVGFLPDQVLRKSTPPAGFCGLLSMSVALDTVSFL